MPFITQGPEGEQSPNGVKKTNWKFLLIVIILAVIIGGWILLGLTLPIPPPWQLSPRTDCSECKAKFVEWCETCRSLGWPRSEKSPFLGGESHSCVGECFKIFFPFTTDCSMTKKTCDDFGVSEILNATVDWKTYRNEEYRFEFKYPKFFTKENGCSIEESENGISIGYRAELSIVDSGGLVLEEYVNQDASAEGIEIEFKEKTTVGGKDAIKVSYRTIGVGRYGTDTYLLKENKVYIFSFFAGSECPATSENDYSELAVLDDIISTFRFIE